MKIPASPDFFAVSNLLKEKNLHTICQSAKCPNISECWSQKTATFLILGDTCTRQCAFCGVKKGPPTPPQPEEPEAVAEAVFSMGLRYAVITSVTRDDLSDGGAGRFAATISAIRKKVPGVKVEILVPDFKGDEAALETVLASHPEVLNHNLEVPKVLYPRINRPPENYSRSLNILKKTKQWGIAAKSGLMVGLGEKMEDILETFSDLADVSCDFLTLGQYLQPGKNQIPVEKYYSPGEFENLKHVASDFGLKGVEAGPLVRSSFRANQLFNSRVQKVDS